MYRKVLVAHRSYLSGVQRALGDAYVKEEFRRHRRADAKFVGPFLEEWDKYVSFLSRGATLLQSHELQQALSPQQSKQLQQLKQAISKTVN